MALRSVSLRAQRRSSSSPRRTPLRVRRGQRSWAASLSSNGKIKAEAGLLHLRQRRPACAGLRVSQSPARFGRPPLTQPGLPTKTPDPLRLLTSRARSTPAYGSLLHSRLRGACNPCARRRQTRGSIRRRPSRPPGPRGRRRPRPRRPTPDAISTAAPAPAWVAIAPGPTGTADAADVAQRNRSASVNEKPTPSAPRTRTSPIARVTQ